MKMTRKGLKMNISKGLRNYSFDKSVEVTTDVRGKHEITKGYRFVDDDENFYLYWHDKDITENDKRENIKLIFELLDNHGFTKYIKLDDLVIRLNENEFKRDNENVE